MHALSLVLAFTAPLAADPPDPGVELRETETGVKKGEGKTKAKIDITSPSGGWSVGRMLLVAGTVSDPTIDPVTVSINGDRYLLRTAEGRFSRSFPAAAGKNVVTVIATNKGGTSTGQVTTYAQVPPVPLKAVLTSDTDGVYTDLHIYEPTDTSVTGGNVDIQKMAHVYWANTESPSGGTFFLNEQGGDYDQPGYGPYLYIHRAPPRGLYLITTNYWPSGDKAHTQANLDIVVDEGTAKETKRTVKIPLATPGTTRALAWVMLTEAGSSIYVPMTDPPPRSSEWPANLQAATRGVNSEAPSEGGDY
jgi:uncharacterized protein YfaP (DUF2135 family)